MYINIIIDKIRQFIFDFEYVIEIFDDVYNTFVNNNFDITGKYNVNDIMLIVKVYWICHEGLLNSYKLHYMDWKIIYKYYSEKCVLYNKIKAPIRYNKIFNPKRHLGRYKEVFKYMKNEIKFFLENNKNYI